MKSCPVCDTPYPDQQANCPTDAAVLIESRVFMLSPSSWDRIAIRSLSWPFGFPGPSLTVSIVRQCAPSSQ